MILRPLNKNKKAQELGFVAFFVVVLVLFIVAPILLKIINEVTTNFFTSMNNTDPSAVAQAQSAVNKTKSFFDAIIIIGIIINLAVLLISAYFIDTHPAFLIVYIIFAFVFILLMPNVLDALDRIYARFATDTTSIPLTDFLREHLAGFILSVIILSGLIMYGKFKYISSGY